MTAAQTSPGSLGIGTTFQQVLRLPGRRLEITFAVDRVRAEPHARDRTFLRGASDPQSGAGNSSPLRVAPASASAVKEHPTLLNLLEPLVAGAARRQARRRLASLKQTLEAQP